MTANEDDDAWYHAEVVLSCCFVLIAVGAFVFSVFGIVEKDWFSAAYAFSAGNLSLAAGCNPRGAVALAIGRAVVPKSRLGYSRFAMHFLAVALLGAIFAWVLESF